MLIVNVRKTIMTNIQILTWIFFIRYVRFQCRWLELTRTRNNGIQGTQSFLGSRHVVGGEPIGFSEAIEIIGFEPPKFVFIRFKGF